MTEPSPSLADLRQRLLASLDRGAATERLGFPLGSLGLRNLFEEEARVGSVDGASGVVTRAEALVDLGERRWPGVQRLLEEVDHLRDLAVTAGMDLARIDAKAGSPREPLFTRPVSEASLDATVRASKLADTVLREAIPRYCVDQARTLGGWAREARARGEKVADAIDAVGRVAEALNDSDLEKAVTALADARRAVATTASSIAARPSAGPDEDQILREAHLLARKLPGSEGGPEPRGPTRVNSGESGERPAGLVPPEEEIEALWAEVDRLTRERDLAASRGLYEPPGPLPSFEPTIPEEAAAVLAVPVGAEPLVPPILVEPPPHPKPAAPQDASPSSPPPAVLAAAETGPPAVPEPSTPVAPAGDGSTGGTASLPPKRKEASPPVEIAETETGKPTARIAFSAAYVPPATAASGASRGARHARGQPRRSRSRHRE